MQQILIKMDTQGNALTNASSKNLGFTNNGTVNAVAGQNNIMIPVTQDQHPDPPPHEPRKI